MSSGAAVNGSPLSGGYADAKATVRFIGSYAAGESDRAGRGITFASVLPRMTRSPTWTPRPRTPSARVSTSAPLSNRPDPRRPPQQLRTSVVAIAGAEPGRHGACRLTTSGLSRLNRS
ncbi:hypothetical protein [Mycobacterium sp. Aquia_216]|uniref:hypothetical protein n=1 Tax=Mycobacterium sp. Aquia_216 TaxID=2991729 RepID=UPI003FA35D25